MKFLSSLGADSPPPTNTYKREFYCVNVTHIFWEPQGIKVGAFQSSLEVPLLGPFIMLAAPVFSLSRFHVTIVLFIE